MFFQKYKNLENYSWPLNTKISAIIAPFQVPRSLIAPYKPDKPQAVYVAGDSMINEHINDGDIAIFKKCAVLTA